MKKLKFAVGYNGKVVFLEKFPECEDALNEMLQAELDLGNLDLDNNKIDYPAGIYLAELEIQRGQDEYGSHDPSGDCLEYKEIIALEIIK